MNWDEAVEEIWKRFYMIDEKLQIEAVKNRQAFITKIFQTKNFNTYCNKEMKGNYKKIVKAILTGSKNYDIDFTQKWCLYNKGKKLFRTANKPADFLENDTDKYALANDLLENKEMLKYLRFTKNEITNFKKAKKARRMEWEYAPWENNPSDTLKKAL